MDIISNYREFKITKTFVDINNINIRNLKPMEAKKIVCGKKYHLPFDYLMTDVMSGCLNYNSTCYGNCTAAIYWLDEGYNFGKPVLNKFNKEEFELCINDLPKNQKWLRQGWMSDCSLTDDSWNLTAQISEVLANKGVTLLIITKIHKYPPEAILKELAKNNVEIRVSLSALDTKNDINKRLKFLLDYKNIGGIAIPYLMTSKYKNETLRNNQEAIIKFIINNDFIAGEHPLRISDNNPLIKELKDDGFYHPKYKNQYWFGRILDDIENFILPAPTHLQPEYSLKYKNFSSIPNNKIIKGVDKNLPTYDDLKNNNFTKEMFDHAAYSIQKN